MADSNTTIQMPLELTEAMIDAALQSTNGYLSIQGSALTVNREKMRIRYRAMVEVCGAAPAPVWPTEGMIDAGAATLLSDLEDYASDISGFARQMAINIYATMISHEDAESHG